MTTLLRGMLVIALAGATAAVASDEETTWIEFDKKAGQNPSSPAGGQLLATGTVNLPPGYKLIKVQMFYQPRGRGNPRLYSATTADLNEKTNPVSWTAKAAGLDWTEYLVHANVTATDPNGKTVMQETWDIRRVLVKKPGKLTN
ncbi:MAG TPA: hypothetical protein VFG68_20890 [Fimbriiglobus sp.]|nr:hypothetical protein [Fimbriiglobus sp.]